MHATVRKTVVSNPYFAREHAESRDNPLTIVAAVNIRESAVATLASRGLLNAAQVAAADRVRQLWERLGGAGAGAIDYSRTYVDGGRTKDPISATQMNAGRELAQCRQLLGVRVYKLVVAVCGERHAMTELFPVKRDRLTATDNLRAGLDDLASMWKLRAKKAG